MNKQITQTAAKRLSALAKECDVSMMRACRAIGMAASTHYRWVTGDSQTTSEQVEKLRRSILRLAHDQGTLPTQHEAEYAALTPGPGGKRPPRNPRAIAKEIARNVRELEQALAAKGGK